MKSNNCVQSCKQKRGVTVVHATTHVELSLLVKIKLELLSGFSLSEKKDRIKTSNAATSVCVSVCI